MTNHVTMTTYYDIHVHCPFCGSSATVLDPNGSLEVGGCSHLLFVSAGDIHVYVSERLDDIIAQNSWKITREPDGSAEIFSDDDDIDVDIVDLLQPFNDAIMFEQIVGPPSLMSSLTAFAYSDKEHEQFQTLL